MALRALDSGLRRNDGSEFFKRRYYPGISRVVLFDDLCYNDSTMLLKIKNILGVFLILGIVMAGFPAQAKPSCPMSTTMQTQKASAMPCQHCKDMVKQAQQHDECSSDFLCKTKCAAMSSGATVFHLPVESIFNLVKTTEKLTTVDHAVAFGVFSSQDRPPK